MMDNTRSERWQITEIDRRTASEDRLRLLWHLNNQLFAESMPDDPPIPWDDFLANCRNAPPYLQVTTWMVFDGDAEVGSLVAAAHFSVRTLDQNRHIAHFGIGVLPAYRRRGLGRRLLALIAEAARRAERTLLMAGTNGNIPAGEVFLHRIGAQAALPSHKNQLAVTRNFDRSLLTTWQPPSDSPIHDEYRLTIEQGRYSEEELPAIVELLNRGTQDVPLGDLRMEAFRYTPQHIRQMEESYLASGKKEHWTAFIRRRHGATEEYVGVTDVIWNASRPTILSQNLTAVLPEHRRRGLGRWLKAALLERLLIEHPEIQFVRTSNADSNEAMLAINRAMGFQSYCTETDWQIETSKVFDYLR